jgi:hypothetical protein
MMNDGYGNGFGGGWMVMGLIGLGLVVLVTVLVLLFRRRGSGPK